jgi:hypothetical protein
LPARRVRTKDEFAAVLAGWVAAPGPGLLEAVVDPAGHARLVAELG